MKLAALAISVPAILGSCTAGSDGPAATAPSAESTVLSAIGTPFLIAFKIPLCVATVLVAGPASGATAVIPPEDNREQGIARQVLADGLKDNCGPPYVVSP